VVAPHDDDPAAVDSLLADLRERIGTYSREDNADPTLVLADEAEANARALWRAAQSASLDGSMPFYVVALLALLHYFRYAALPLGEDRNDLQAALVLFAHVYRVEPERVPNHLLEMRLSEDNVEPVIPDNVGEVPDQFGMPAWVSGSYSSWSYPSSYDYMVSYGPDWWTREADVLLARARTDEDPEAVDRAVSLLRQAVQHTPPADHADYAERLSKLSVALRVQFERTGIPDHLDEAVEYGRAAVAARPQDDHQRAAILNNLGAILGIRFQQSGNLTDVDDAISNCREAVEAVPASHPNRVPFLANLGNALGSRIDLTDNPADWDDYIAAYRSAAEAAPADHPDRPRILARLDKGLRTRFQRTGNPADAEEALRIEEEIG
jgi:tetratricopeptide (TPR) repeat protein